jgi:YbbR domain-containing protein
MAVRIFQHIGFKLLSLALALLLWSLVAGQKEAERSLRVALEFQNMSPSLEMMGEPPSFVDVRLKGPSAALAQLRGSELVATVDLSMARAGRRMFHLMPDHVNTPVGVRALGIVPPTIALTFETSTTKTVPVVPAIDGDPAPGYEIGRIGTVPSSVEVVGPESVVRQLTQATTEPVNVGGAMGRVRDTVTIGVPDSSVRLKIPQSALVTVEIAVAPVDRVLSGVPVDLRHVARGLKAAAQPGMVAVRARGPAETVRALRADHVPAYVDLSGLQRGRYNLTVRVEPTGGFTPAEIHPATVQVIIR